MNKIFYAFGISLFLVFTWIVFPVNVRGDATTTPNGTSTPPVVVFSAITPSLGPIGTKVRVIGKGFSNYINKIDADFADPCAKPGCYYFSRNIVLTTINDNSLEFTVPQTILNGPYEVPVTFGSYRISLYLRNTNLSAKFPFTVSAVPIVDSISPTEGPPGTQVTINGVRFDGIGNTSVVFGRANRVQPSNVIQTLSFSGLTASSSSLTITIPFSYSPPSKIKLLKPLEPGNYTIQVINSRGKSNVVPFTVVKKESVTVNTKSENAEENQSMMASIFSALKRKIWWLFGK